MKVLLVGSGAREHCIAEALVKGGAEMYAYVQMRNPGITKLAKGIAAGGADDVAAAVAFAKKSGAELAVIGPEAPLAAGMVDGLDAAGVKCFGPAKKLALLETSKAFARELLARHGIAGNPAFQVFHRSSSDHDMREFLQALGSFVVKPDGLTGGKGVKVSGEHLKGAEDGVQYCREVLKTHHAVIVEEKLDGEEFSLQSITDGSTIVDCPPVQDHKRAHEDDTGPNTGGMGSYSDADHLLPFLSRGDVEEAHAITVAVVRALRKECGAYKGVMYGGFMKTAKGVRLLEYNARFGDPEAMNVLPLLKANFGELCKAVVEGRLGDLRVAFEKKATVCKYVVPQGYPAAVIKGEISVSETTAKTYYAAVEEKNGKLHTTGSRAVAFVGIGDSIAEAEGTAERAAAAVKGKVFHRKDIGTERLLRKRLEHMKGLWP